MPNNSELFVVSSHFNEDVSWLKYSGFPHFVVSKGECIPSVEHFFSIPNRGAEFSSYLWFILNFWDDLPSKIAFVHGHEDSYHQQYTIPVALKIFRDCDFSGINGEMCLAMHRFDVRHPWFGDKFSEAWNFLGLDAVCPPPLFAAIQPGTQSVVSKDLIIAKGRHFYERLFNVLMSHGDHYFLALVLEIAWQVIFEVPPENPSLLSDEFREVFDRDSLSVLIAHPNQVWHSDMDFVVFFERNTHCVSTWVSRCLEAMEKYSKVY